MKGEYMKVSFYEYINDDKLKFAVIVSIYQDKWVFCKHKLRDTYEIPGGHRELGEDIEACAKRELYEETGALDFKLERICDYGVIGKSKFNHDGKESFGTLFYAKIECLGQLPDSEIDQIYLFEQLPLDWTYPEIQPYMIDEIKKRNKITSKDNL